MKKQLLSTLTLILFSTAFSQVGINTDTPQATLDIGGNLRIKTRGPGENDEKMLTISSNGIVNERKIDDIAVKKYRVSQSVLSGQTVVVNNIHAFDDSNINVISQNGCGRSMIASFISSDGAITLTGGVARDKPALYDIEPIQPGIPAYSANLKIIFHEITTCTADGGTATQFDFSFRKLSNTQYEITNNGNVTRVYEITWVEI